jgi:hypothetical protein
MANNDAGERLADEFLLAFLLGRDMAASGQNHQWYADAVMSHVRSSLKGFPHPDVSIAMVDAMEERLRYLLSQGESMAKLMLEGRDPASNSGP